MIWIMEEKFIELSEYLCKMFGAERMCRMIAKASDERIYEMLDEFGIW